MADRDYKREILEYIDKHGVVDKDSCASGDKGPDGDRGRSYTETVDLHGKTRREADIILDRVFSGAGEKGVKRVRIIHGRGFSSDDGPVLKVHVRSRLKKRYAPYIKKIKQESPEKGGSGVTVAVLN